MRSAYLTRCAGGRTSRWIGAVMSLALLATLLTGLGSRPDRPLPVGASPTAPQQRVGDLDGTTGHGVSADATRATLDSPPRDQPRPGNAVPDRRAPLPEIRKPDLSRRDRVTPELTQQRETGPLVDSTSKELPAERTATTQTFQNGDGTRTVRSYPGPVNVRQPDGTWQPNDLTLTSDKDRLRPKVSPLPISFASSATADDLAAFTIDAGQTVTFGFPAETTAAGQVDGPAVTYPGVRRGMDLRLTAQDRGIAMHLVLASPDAPASYELKLRLAGLEPRLTDAGTVELADASGQTRATIPAASLTDARSSTTGTARYALAKADGGAWTLRVDADQVWLRDTGRAYPVTISSEPTKIFGDADGDDGYVASNGENGNVDPNNKVLKIGSPDGGRTINRSYLHFTAFPRELRNAYIVGASLAVVNTWSQSCSPRPVTLFEVAEPWSNPGMRWPGPSVGRALSTQSFAHGPTGCGPAREAFPIADQNLLTQWTHGAPFHGLGLRATDERDTAGFKHFAAWEAHPDNRPYLDVKYSNEGAAYEVTDVELPTATRDGWARAVVTNWGRSVWPAGGGFRLGCVIVGVPGKACTWTPPAADIGPGGSGVFERVVIPPLDPGEYEVLMTMYGPANEDFHAAYDVPYGSFRLRVRNIPPTSNFQQPGSGAALESLTPTLYAEAVDSDNWPNRGFKYRFRICTNQELTEGCQESDWQDWQSWTPGRGTLRWSTTYYWAVKTSDTVDETPNWFGPLVIRTRVPQPQITSHLAGSPDRGDAPGLDPNLGNYSTVATDAVVSTVGPDLTITRTYNSLDPRRNTAFGVGWASRLDMRLAEDGDGSGSVVVTYPTGRQIRMGRDPDGPGGQRAYAPPSGQNLTLAFDQRSGGYTLRDATGGQWRFDALGRLVAITDPAGLTERLTYGAGDQVEQIRNEVSGRSLFLTWTGKHVTSVRTDVPDAATPPLTWTYGYDGDKLTRACQPGPEPNCTTYSYQAGSHYRSAVIDDNPVAYWRLSETSGDKAASVVARNPGADAATYHNVVLGTGGAVGGTADKAATFDGTASYVTLPEKLPTGTMGLAVELWFRTTDRGALLGYADQPFPNDPGQSTPVLYVGSDGLLYGGFAMRAVTGPRQVMSKQAVNDGAWHHAVLSANIDHQKLYVDGVEQGIASGYIDHGTRSQLVLGAAKGKDYPATNGANFHFAGAVDEVAFYRHPLGPLAARQHFTVGRAVDQLTGITWPQDDRLNTQLSYDDRQNRVRTLRDNQGRAWTLDAPSVAETAVDPNTKVARRTVVLHGPYPDFSYVFDLDNSGRTIERSHAGATRRYEYNTKDFTSALVDENGHRFEQTTDARGNVLSRKGCRASGSCHTRYASYVSPSADLLDPRTDKLASTSDQRTSGPDDTRFRASYSYDAQGRLIATTLPAPVGVPAAGTETRVYSTGSEAAVGGGNVPAGLLVKAVGRRGQETRYGYRRTGDLAEVVAPTGLRTRYGYDGIGRQTTVTTANAGDIAFGTTSTAYTPRSQIETITEPAVTNPVTGVMHTKVTSYRYDGDGNTVEVTIADATPTDRGGDRPRTTTFGYDASDRLVRTTFPDGGVEQRAYSDDGRTLVVTDVRGFAWTSQFDSKGRLVARSVSGQGVDPQDGNATALTLEMRDYDPTGRLASTVDAMGRRTSYTYYDDNLLATVTRNGYTAPDGTVRDVPLEQRRYDPAGKATEIVTAGGRTTATEYDPAGYPASVTVDPAGLKRVTRYVRDADGNPTRVEHTGAAAPGRVEASEFGYDAGNQVVREDAFLGSGTALSTQLARDERGLVRAATDRRLLTTSFSYDATGQPVSVTHPAVDAWVAGQQRAGFVPVETTGRNTFGEPTDSRDPAGGVSRTEYDLMGRAAATVSPDYTPPGGQTIRGATTRTEHDRAGNPVKVTDQLGRVTEQTFDPYGRVRSSTPPKVGDAPSTTRYGYDRDGELLSQVRPSDAETRFTYDELGRRITATQVERHPGPLAYFITQFGHDDAGNLLSVRTPRGNTSTATYNAAGEVLSQADPIGRTTTFGYDDAGRQGQVTGPDGIATLTTYDLLGRPTRVADVVGGQEQRAATTEYDENDNPRVSTSPEGRRVEAGYDKLDRLVTQTERVDAATSISVSLGYDLLGNRSRFVDGEGRATLHTSTPWSQPESVIEPATATDTDPAARTWTTSYDAAGQPATLTAPGGVTRIREFDAQGRPAAEKGSGAEAATTDRTFGYDADSRLTRVGGPSGDSGYRYDDRGDLLETTGPAGQANYTYNADGLLASKTDVTGTATFGYDPAGRLGSVTDPLTGRTIDYGYDAAGRPATITDRTVSRSINRRLGYDQLGRLSSDKLLEAYAGGVPPRTVIGREYGYDRDDKQTTETAISAAGTQTNAYGYDGAGRLTSWTDPGGKATAYGWDKAGNRIAAGDQTFSYDERNRLLSGGGASYTYTARGTLASATENGQTRRLAFDAFDRLVTDGSVRYGYDSLDRVADRNGVRFQYAGLSNDAIADWRRLISRLPDGAALSDKAVDGSAGAKLLFADQHGDVVARYLGSGTDGQRTFDPFGATLSSSGDTSNLGYQGDWTDIDTGRVNMTARWYTPSTGTFASRDSLTLDPSPSAAANRYQYADNDPVNATDPTGHCTDYEETRVKRLDIDLGIFPIDIVYGEECVPAYGAVPQQTNYGSGNKVECSRGTKCYDSVGRAAAPPPSPPPGSGQPKKKCKGQDCGKPSGKCLGTCGSHQPAVRQPPVTLPPPPPAWLVAALTAVATWTAGEAVIAVRAVSVAIDTIVDVFGAVRTIHVVDQIRKIIDELQELTSDEPNNKDKPDSQTRTDEDDEEYIDLYHGTTKEGAASIRGNGVDVTHKASPDQHPRDFGQGFYTTRFYEQAWDRVVRVLKREKSNSEIEVLHFRIPKKKLDELNTLKFYGEGFEWQLFVLSNFQGATHPYDAVEGPLVVNAWKVREWGIPPRARKNSHQMSFHTKRAQDLLNTYLQPADGGGRPMGDVE